MSNLFEGDSDEDANIKTDNDYAKKYDVWRKKEELNKLKTKYGEDIDAIEDSSSSSDDDEEGVELTEKVEKDFFKTLACLKNKDPRIYDENIKFFDDRPANESGSKKEKVKKNEPMYLKDYERNIILEKGGILSDEEDDEEKRPRSPTYVEEQRAIKENLKKALNSVNEEGDDDWGGLFKERKKTKEEKEKEETEYKKWLVGRASEIADKEVETDLKPLKDYWNNPELDDGEKFLRDYILNKKFLDHDEDDYIPTYDEIIHDSDEDLSNDEKTIEKQEEFEHKYNFRFEEPDQEFIKRYPRSMENSVRRKDDKRKLKRQETKERKKKEKEEKMKDLKKLQELKRKEIEEKLDKLREITGNTDIGFADEDIDGDFDPEAHDKRMQALFNDEFYEGPEGDQKPEFPDLDEELEIENWDRYEGDYENEGAENVPHCEDDDFNMDCDYDPHTSTQKELLETSRGKKKRKRKSKFAEAVSKPKPKYDPNDKNYEKYFEEYYKLDCEDIIGDIPCRFKYRKVVPNDFGLTTEEILFAKERELNRWCSLKKAVQIRPDHVEKYEQIAYQKKAQNVNLKKKVLPSLYSDSLEGDSQEGDETTVKNKEGIEPKVDNVTKDGVKNDNENSEGKVLVGKATDEATKNREKKKKKKATVVKDEKLNLAQEGNSKVIINNANVREHDDVKCEVTPANQNSKVSKRKKKKKKKTPAKDAGESNNNDQSNAGKTRKRKLSVTDKNKIDAPRKKIKKETNKIKELKISDARLSAYGINPKKFKNKLKYRNR